MKFSISSNTDHTIVELSGRLTFKENRVFTDLIAELFDKTKPNPRCIFDLENVDFIDSAGIGMLLIAKDKATDLNVEIVLANAPESALRIIQIARLDRLFTIE